MSNPLHVGLETGAAAVDPFAVFEKGEAGAWPPVHDGEPHPYRGARLDSGASIISESGDDPLGAQMPMAQPNSDLSNALRRLSLDASMTTSNNPSMAYAASSGATAFGQPRRLSHLPAEDAAHFAAMQYAPPMQLSGLTDQSTVLLPVVSGLLVPPTLGESPGHTPSPDFTNNATPSPKTLSGGNGPPPIKSRNVYIAALPIGFTDQHLAEMLGQFGKITSARMFNDTRRVEAVGRSYGFALFDRAEDAEAAVQGLSGLVIDGRRIQIRLSLNGVVRAPRSKPPEYGAAMSPSAHSSPRMTSGSHPATPSSSQHSFAVTPGVVHHAGSPSTTHVLPPYGSAARTSPQLMGQMPLYGASSSPQQSQRTPTTLLGAAPTQAMMPPPFAPTLLNPLPYPGAYVPQQQQQQQQPPPFFGLVAPHGYDPLTGQPVAAYVQTPPAGVHGSSPFYHPPQQ